jgi:hypothetical protein
MHRHLVMTSLLLIGVCRLSSVRADVPATINYQGQVLGAGGAPVAGPVNVDIGIWDAANGGTRLYREQHLNTPLANGVYTLRLGTGPTPTGTFNAATFEGANRWLELAINGETLSPRQPFSSVAYALRAQDAETVDGVDSAALMPRAGGNFTGGVTVNGPNGSGNVLLGAGTNPNFGFVGALNDAGQSRASLSVIGSGDGSVSVARPNGDIAALMGVVANGGLMMVLNSDRNVASFLATDRGAGKLELLGPNGQRNVLLGPNANIANHGVVTLHDAQGVIKVLIIVDENAQGIVDVVNTKNLPAVGVRVMPTGDGVVFLEGPEGAIGNLNVLLGAVSGDPNRGSISVHDHTSVAKAGLFVNSQGKGQIFADVKNFVVDHPNHPGKKIIYTSLEGPEVAIYHRGVVRLADGRATIELPEHFVALAAPGSVTMQLTPVSLQSKGLGIARITDESVDIGELYDGTGSYDVHYVVHGLRRGYEDHHPVVASDEFQARAAQPRPPDPLEIAPPVSLPLRSLATTGNDSTPAETEAVLSAIHAISPQ